MSSSPVKRWSGASALALLLFGGSVQGAVRSGAIVVSDKRGPMPPLGVGPGAIVEVEPGGFHSFESLVLDEDGTLLAIAWDEDAVRGGIVRIDPDSAAIDPISTGGLLHFARGVALEEAGTILVGDDDAGIVRVALDGSQSLLSSGGWIEDPQDLAVEADGSILVVDSLMDVVLRVDPITGEQTVLSSGGSFHNPSGLAIEADGSILVADETCCAEPGGDPFPGGIFRVDPVSGEQSLVSGAGLFRRGVRDVVADGRGSLYVTDRIAGLIRVDATTGEQELVSSGENLQEPWGLVAWPAAPSLLRILRWPARPDAPPTRASPPCPARSPAPTSRSARRPQVSTNRMPTPCFRRRSTIPANSSSSSSIRSWASTARRTRWPSRSWARTCSCPGADGTARHREVPGAADVGQALSVVDSHCAARSVPRQARITSRRLTSPINRSFSKTG